MKVYSKNIIPECYADTLLVELLGFPYPNHALNSCISSVLKVVKASKPNERVVGIIDSDRGKSEKLLEQFIFIEELHGIKKYTRENQTVLVLYPALEEWIFNNASAKNIKKYGFEDPKYFRQVCKSSKKGKTKDQLKNFLNTMKQVPSFSQLKTWICEGAGIDENEL